MPEKITDYKTSPEDNKKGFIVNGTWNVSGLPDQYIVELSDGSLHSFSIQPFRKINSKDFKEYKGSHPRKLKGAPMPDYLYQFYGLSRNEESLTEVIRVRISPSEKEKLDNYAKNDGKNVSEFIRDYIRSL